jgi:hypothetical protein
VTNVDEATPLLKKTPTAVEQAAPVKPVTMQLRGLDEITSSMMTPESLKELGHYIANTLSGGPRANRQRSLRESRARNAKWYARKRAKSNGFHIEYEMVFYDLVFFRDSGKCGICGKDVGFEVGTLDHITPVTKGGSHTYDNVQLAHQSCNREKADNEPGVHSGREG